VSLSKLHRTPAILTAFLCVFPALVGKRRDGERDNAYFLRFSASTSFAAHPNIQSCKISGTHSVKE